MESREGSLFEFTPTTYVCVGSCEGVCGRVEGQMCMAEREKTEQASQASRGELSQQFRHATATLRVSENPDYRHSKGSECLVIVVVLRTDSESMLILWRIVIEQYTRPR
ncbi:putative tubulin--tyrosine ligase PBY1 [Fusarium oxysporum f. sp. albedinis]|nr:putative tubulin--tyrosine ligase PBY1 [Fusarium oxysporum f. sp. albedinis]